MWIVEVTRLDDHGVGRHLLAYVLAIGATAPLAARRMAPRTVFAVMAVCFAGRAPAGVGFDGHRLRARRVHDLGRPVAARRCGCGGRRLRVDPPRPRGSRGDTLTDLFFNAITFAMVIAIAELMRTRLAYARIHAERTAQLDADRIAVTQRAVDSERLRIARELHDVVAHSISSIAVQSSVGRERLRTDPDVTEEALRAIESSSRTALSEMRRMLGILRPDGESSGGLSPRAGSRACG